MNLRNMRGYEEVGKNKKIYTLSSKSKKKAFKNKKKPKVYNHKQRREKY